jgi:hypothetical protein
MMAHMTFGQPLGVFAALALLAVVGGGCAAVDLQDPAFLSTNIQENRGSAAHQTQRTLPSVATALRPAANTFESLAIASGIDPDAGSAESVCPGAGAIEHVEEFRGSPSFPKTLIADLQKATVRISMQPKEQLTQSLRDVGLSGTVDLGGFNGFEAWGRGFCTGTLITRNIVLTAGHCISPRYWQNEKGVHVPQVINRVGEARPFRAKELARLMQVQFDYQNHYLADVNAFQPPSGRADILSARVVEMISADYLEPESISALDYALLRIETVDSATQKRLEASQLGLARLQLIPIEKGRPIAIIQHPSGFEKKVATGSILDFKGARLYYKNVSTEGGSSGAAVLSSQGRVVGIHTRGGCASPLSGSANKGMSLHRLKDIIATLREPS